MKQFKKILAFALVLVLAFSVMSLSAFAEDEPAYTITIDNAVKGETYTAYKIFDVTYSGTNDEAVELPEAPAPDGRSLAAAYSYSIVEDSAWWSTVTSSGTTDSETGVITANGLTFTPTTAKVGGKTVYNVAATASFDPATFATLLDGAKSEKDSAATGEASGTTITLTVTTAGPGYYFVDTSTGSLCSLDTTEPSATIREKNTIPSDDKKVKDEDDSHDYGEHSDVAIGDTVNFQITVTDGKGTDKPIKVHDVMSDGLTLNADSIAINGLTKETDYIVLTQSSKTATLEEKEYTIDSTCTFEVIISAAKVKALDENGTYVITYTATVNENASYAEKETNKTHIDYSEQSTQDVEVEVETYKVEILKYDGSDSAKKNLAGAVFQLQDSNGNVIKVVGSGTNYRKATSSDEAGASETFTTVDSGNIVIDGLDNDKTYLLEEITAPDGYNKLTSKISFQPTKTTTETTTGEEEEAVTTTSVSYLTEEVANNAGTQLPSTGGIGTTIFYVIGGLMVVGAGVVLVTKKRVGEE
ncbi:MAG: SpaH/EbpB family LPXTG-anchored major pilin [Oscillospiraceae bacterium]|nr:SpaH/EbpB family LPXTG-anchored major pilin [Oscillospiraceae bacterium]